MVNYPDNVDKSILMQKDTPTEVSSTVCGGAIEPALDSFTHFCLHCLSAVMECFEHLHMVQIP